MLETFHKIRTLMNLLISVADHFVKMRTHAFRVLVQLHTSYFIRFDTVNAILVI